MRKTKFTFGVALAVFSLSCVWITAVLASNARDYKNAPINMNMPAYYFTHKDDHEDANVPNSRSTTNGNLFRFTRIFGFKGRTGGLNVLLPYRYITLKNSTGEKSNGSGVGDPTISIDYNVFGAPALTKEEFARWKPETYMSAHFSTTFPVGSYNKNKELNIGSNRWSFCPKLNYSYTPDAGTSWLEVYFGVKFFTDNTDYRGSNKLSNDPLCITEVHCSRNLTPKFWVGVDAYYDYGKESSIDDVRQDNRKNNLSLGCTVRYGPWWGGQILLKYMSTVAKPSSQPNTQEVQLYISQLF